jgi:hypothetical protein
MPQIAIAPPEPLHEGPCSMKVEYVGYSDMRIGVPHYYCEFCRKALKGETIPPQIEDDDWPEIDLEINTEPTEECLQRKSLPRADWHACYRSTSP